MNGLLAILTAAVLLAGGDARAASDGFGTVRCGPDIAKALAGQRMSDEAVAAVEARHQDLGLKDLGGSEVSDSLFLSSWRICGDEYQLLEERGVVRDVLKFPPHSKEMPEFIGACRRGKDEVPGAIIAVLKNEAGGDALAATAAWKIDEGTKKFVKLDADGLRCPRDGVITADGGL